MNTEQTRENIFTYKKRKSLCKLSNKYEKIMNIASQNVKSSTPKILVRVKKSGTGST